jgi:hypothetical protein
MRTESENLMTGRSMKRKAWNSEMYCRALRLLRSLIDVFISQVLLYNFFQDSSVDYSQWRVVLNAIEDSAILAPSFDETHHAGVCSEVRAFFPSLH